jgi:hypothetical protein
VTDGRDARDLPIQKQTLANKGDSAVPAAEIAWRFSTKNKLRIAVEVSSQPRKLLVRTVAGLVVAAMVVPWVEQRRQSRRKRIGQEFG